MAQYDCRLYISSNKILTSCRALNCSSSSVEFSTRRRSVVNVGSLSRPRLLIRLSKSFILFALNNVPASLASGTDIAFITALRSTVTVGRWSVTALDLGFEVTTITHH